MGVAFAIRPAPPVRNFASPRSSTGQPIDAHYCRAGVMPKDRPAKRRGRVLTHSAGCARALHGVARRSDVQYWRRWISFCLDTKTARLASILRSSGTETFSSAVACLCLSAQIVVREVFVWTKRAVLSRGRDASLENRKGSIKTSALCPLVCIWIAVQKHWQTRPGHN
jgi:hypothetical protein